MFVGGSCAGNRVPQRSQMRLAGRRPRRFCVSKATTCPPPCLLLLITKAKGNGLLLQLRQRQIPARLGGTAPAGCSGLCSALSGPAVTRHEEFASIPSNCGTTKKHSYRQPEMLRP